MALAYRKHFIFAGYLQRQVICVGCISCDRTGNIHGGRSMPTGTVKWFDTKKGFGFIVNAEGKDVFVHYTSITGEGFRALKDGEQVEYEQVQGDKGLLAKNVQRIATREKEKVQ